MSATSTVDAPIKNWPKLGVHTIILLFPFCFYSSIKRLWSLFMKSVAIWIKIKSRVNSISYYYRYCCSCYFQHYSTNSLHAGSYNFRPAYTCVRYCIHDVMNTVYVRYKYPYCICVTLTTSIHLDTSTPSNAYMGWTRTTLRYCIWIISFGKEWLCCFVVIVVVVVVSC
jgi:hypothetical protein